VGRAAAVRCAAWCSGLALPCLALHLHAVLCCSQRALVPHVCVPCLSVAVKQCVMGWSVGAQIAGLHLSQQGGCALRCMRGAALAGSRPRQMHPTPDCSQPAEPLLSHPQEPRAALLHNLLLQVPPSSQSCSASCSWPTPVLALTTPSIGGWVPCQTRNAAAA
jgi:hypothetical protein